MSGATLRFALLAGALFLLNAIAYEYGGPIGETRLYGGLFACAALRCALAPELPFNLGNVEVARLRGWKKYLVAALLASLGAAMVVFSKDITCVAGKHRHQPYCR